MDPKITPPSAGDIDRFAKQYLQVGAIAKLHLERDLAGDATDLDVVQAILDCGALTREDTSDLQCLGIVLGMRLVSAVDGLDWAIVEDEYGRDPALRYLDTSLLLFPLTMISKRIEDGIEVDVHTMFEGVCAKVAELKNVVARPN